MVPCSCTKDKNSIKMLLLVCLLFRFKIRDIFSYYTCKL